MTLAPDRRPAPSPHRPGPEPRQRGNGPSGGPSRGPSGSFQDPDQPVEFWSTAAIRSALQGGDIATWKRIAGALKRDPYGRTARQVEEVLEGTRPYGIAKALWEVLERARTHLEANERAEVARHVGLLIERSGLTPTGVRVAHRGDGRGTGRLPRQQHQPDCRADDPDQAIVGPVREGEVGSLSRSQLIG